ncbi:hypothetical protein [Neorhizobium galegae]|uniref:hypothetical protein n=1 Tax=Neorhizobium galegae TaxID=399 RepID=UPI001F29B178|nr:hypothetical protein [Neorhizobium galegae]UIK04821.1 hypothetical protein LZK81_19490 [Neorhizobium galegae]
MKRILMACLLLSSSTLNGFAQGGIEGRYSVKDGSTAEFLKDGTLIIVIGGVQALWKWTDYGGGRLKLEPGAGVEGVRGAICNYDVSTATLLITGCEWAMKLARMP